MWLCLNKKNISFGHASFSWCQWKNFIICIPSSSKTRTKTTHWGQIATPKISLHFISHLLKIPLCIFSFGARWHRMVISPPTQPQPQKLCFFVASFNRKIVAIQYFCIKLTATQILLQKFNCLLLILFCISCLKEKKKH